MPFLHDHSIKKYHNSNRTVYPAPKSGFVSVLTKQNKLYEGNWVNDKREGFGSYVNKINNIEYTPKYKGNWFANKQHGIGNGYMNDGYYVGEWRCNRRHGYGKMWYIDGSFYAGDWKSNQREGDGLFVQYNGDRYEGEWKDDKKHGLGRFYHLATGQMQEGEWCDDIVIHSTIEDISFRQSALCSTEYPIPPTQQKTVRFSTLQEIKII